MKRALLTAVTAVAVLLLAFLPAGALTLEATSGYVRVQQGPWWDPTVHPSGKNWELSGWSGFGFSEVLSVSTTFFFHANALTLDGVADKSLDCCNNNAWMTISHNAAHVSPPPSIFYSGFQPFSLPFSMTAHIPLAGGVDLAGHGILNVTRDDSSSLVFSYRFIAPEPPSALLVAFAALTVWFLVAALRRQEKGDRS